MARIPTPASQGAQSLGGQGVPSPVATPQLNVQAPDLGRTSRAVFKNLASAAESGADLANTLQREEDNRQLMEVQNSWKEREREALFGENGVFTRRGRNALGSTDALEERSEEFKRELLDGREMSARARRTAEQWIDARRSSTLRSVAQHEMSARQSYNDELMGAALQNSKEEAGLYYNDPEKFAASRERVRVEATEVGKSRGLGGEALDEYVDNNVSQMYVAGIKRAIGAGQSAVAEELFNVGMENGDIEGDVVSRVESLVRDASNQQRGFQLAEASMAAHPDDLEQQLEYVRSQAGDNAQLRDEAVSEVKMRFNERQNIAENRRKERYDNLRSRVERGYNPSVADMDGLSESQKKVLREKRDRYRMRQINPDWDRPTNHEVYNNLQQMFEESPRAIAEMSFSEFEERFFSGLSSKQWTVALSQRRALVSDFAEKQRAAEEGALNVQGVTEMQALNANAELIAGTDADPEVLQEVKSRLYLEYDRRLRQFDHDPTVEERRRVLDNLVDETIVTEEPGRFFDGTTQRTFLMDEEQSMEFLEDIGIPAPHRAAFAQNIPRIAFAIRNSGMKVSRDSMQQAMQYATSEDVGPGNAMVFIDSLPQIARALRENGLKVNRTNVIGMWNEPGNRRLLGVPGE